MPKKITESVKDVGSLQVKQKENSLVCIAKQSLHTSVARPQCYNICNLNEAFTWLNKGHISKWKTSSVCMEFAEQT